MKIDNINMLNDSIISKNKTLIHTIDEDSIKRIITLFNQVKGNDYSIYITILLGLIAGIIALHQVKSNIISNARIKWIEDFRNHLSEYIVETQGMFLIAKDLYDSYDTNEEIMIESTTKKLYTEKSNKSRTLALKLTLLLDKKKEDEKSINNLIIKINNYFNTVIEEKKRLDNKENIKDINKLIDLSGKLITKKWKKSKCLLKI